MIDPKTRDKEPAPSKFSYETADGLVIDDSEGEGEPFDFGLGDDVDDAPSGAEK